MTIHIFIGVFEGWGQGNAISIHFNWKRFDLQLWSWDEFNLLAKAPLYCMMPFLACPIRGGKKPMTIIFYF